MSKQTMIPKMIGLTGFAGSGKDAVSEQLLPHGYKKHTIGNLIKKSLTPGENCMKIDRLVYLIEHKHTKYIEHLPKIAKAYFDCKLGYVDPFTDDPIAKAGIRPLLEVIGLADYTSYFDQFFASLPEVCLNTRICHLDEANEWVNRGGVIIEVVRKGVGPATGTEDEWIFQLKKEGLIDYTFANWGSIEESQDRFIRSLYDFSPAAYDVIPLSEWAGKSNAVMTPDEYAETFKYLMTPIFSVSQACGKG